MNKLVLAGLIVGIIMIGQRILQFILQQAWITIAAWIVVFAGLWAGISLIQYARRSKST